MPCSHERIFREVAEIVHPDHTALVVVDVQNDFAHSDGMLAKQLGQDMTHVQAALAHINEAIELARGVGAHVVYLQEVIAAATMLPNFETLFGPFEGTAVREGTWGAEFVDELLQPRECDRVVRKPCYDGFQDSALDVTLRALGVRTCIYCGGATNVCVESTARHGFVNGYYTVLLDDACGAANAQEHEATVNTFRVFYGPVLEVAELRALWSGVAAAAVS